MICKRNRKGFVGVNIAFLDDFTRVNRLNWVVVAIKSKIATGAVEISRFQCRTERVRIFDICFCQSGNQQVCGIKTLACVKRWQTTIFSLKTLNKSLVGWVIQILIPLRRVDNTKSRLTNGLQDALIK